MAIAASAARTTSPLRSSPKPVGRASVTCGLASARSSPGRMPTLVPPACAAPRQAASITPPRPPHTTIAPRSARRRPSSSAMLACSGVASPDPITATYTALTP
jgi:hypothetical protein